MADQRDSDDGKVACAKCGARILAATAKETGGLCMPCHTGMREHIDRAIREARERQSTRDPFEVLWLELVKRVSHQGFESLADPEKLFFAAALVEMEVNNGGLFQYFFNSSADHYNDAIRALEDMNAEPAVAVLQMAKQALFPMDEMPVSTGARRKLLPEWQDLDQLDLSFFTDPKGLNARLRAFALRHGLFESP